MRSGSMQILRVLDTDLFQYFESEIKRAMERETTSDTVAMVPPSVIVSRGKEVCTTLAAIMLITIFKQLL